MKILLVFVGASLFLSGYLYGRSVWHKSYVSILSSYREAEERSVNQLQYMMKNNCLPK